MTADRDLTILRLPDVCAMTGLPRATVYEYIAGGHFPRPIKLGASQRSSGWVRAEIEEWIAARIAERDRQHQAA